MIQQQQFIDARVNYVATASGVSYHRQSHARSGETVDFASAFVRIFDARQSEALFGLDDSGFSLISAGEAGWNLRRPGISRKQRLEAAEFLVSTFVPARRVLAFDIIPPDEVIRNRLAHVRDTPESAVQRVRDLLGVRSESVPTRSFALIDVWMPQLQDRQSSLALIHGLTLSEEDLVPAPLGKGAGNDWIYGSRFNRGHVWLYYPAIAAHEALLMKTFDSRTDGRARYAFRTVFGSVAPPAPAPSATAFMARTLVLF